MMTEGWDDKYEGWGKKNERNKNEAGKDNRKVGVCLWFGVHMCKKPIAILIETKTWEGQMN